MRKFLLAAAAVALTVLATRAQSAGMTLSYDSYATTGARV